MSFFTHLSELMTYCLSGLVDFLSVIICILFFHTIMIFSSKKILKLLNFYLHILLNYLPLFLLSLFLFSILVPQILLNLKFRRLNFLHFAKRFINILLIIPMLIYYPHYVHIYGKSCIYLISIFNATDHLKHYVCHSW